MKSKLKHVILSASLAMTVSSSLSTVSAATAEFPTLSSLGEHLFTDNNLSLSRTQSCATCHNPREGFIDTRNNGIDGAVSIGHDGFSLGNRNAPTISYAAFTPNFTGTNANNARGGQFWDGRSSDLVAQAGEPQLNPIEMGMLSKADVVSRLQENNAYVEAFQSYFGENVFDDTELAYTAMSESLAAFEQSDAVSPFDSKFDRHLTGDYTLTNAEQRGMNLYFSNQTSCTRCHSTTMNNRNGQGGGRGNNRNNPAINPATLAGSELFTNFRYFNNGTPSNTDLNNLLASVGAHSEFLNTGDLGLFDNPQLRQNDNSRGRFRVSTLRNIAVTAPYMHNGVFQNLRTVLAFYDHQGGNPQRSINPETGAAWDTPETPETVDNQRLRMRNLSNNQIDDLECFLRTLTDQHFEATLPPLRDGLSCS